MWDIFLFEMLGTGVLTGATDLLGSNASLTNPQSSLIFICVIYFSMLIICTPISGGHLNPAYTISVYALCTNKKDKLQKMLLMIFA